MKHLKERHLFIRNLHAPVLMENFLIAAVTTILTIRVYLQLTGYPQVGGAHFHIAHMLYGGIFMVIAMFILFGFLNRSAYTIASVLGGVGFGFFIDELGKFITRDNNYFFQPTVALIYIIFIILYLIAQLLPKYKTITEQEYLVNALELTKEVIVQDLEMTEKKQALLYLKASDPANPMVKDLKKTLNSFESVPDLDNPYTRIKAILQRIIERIITDKRFYFTVILLIIIQSLLSLLITFYIIAALNRYAYLMLALLLLFFSLYLLRKTTIIIRMIFLLAAAVLLSLVYYGTSYELPIRLSFTGWGTLISTALAAFVAFIGLLEYNRSALYSLRYFRISILISLFLTQFFLFYRFQFLALIGVIFNILILLTIEYVITKKEAALEILEGK